jgi:hypothetical protein
VGHVPRGALGRRRVRQDQLLVVDGHAGRPARSQERLRES